MAKEKRSFGKIGNSFHVSIPKKAAREALRGKRVNFNVSIKGKVARVKRIGRR